MEIQERDNRFFGILGLILMVCGLTLPYIVHGVAGEEETAGFAITSLILALVFSIIGCKSKPGLVALIISAIAVAFLSFVFLMRMG